MSERKRSTPAPAAPSVGPDYLVAGRYRLRSTLGGGGMGTVWLAHDKVVDRDVALKQILTTAGMDVETAQEVRERAMREGRTVARLANIHIAAMYDVTLDRGEPWLVMEYLPSRSLAQVLRMTGTLPITQVAQIGAQIADALAEAHAAGILHRDIKPGNILVADRGRQAGTVKIADFGISQVQGLRHAEDAAVLTGTPAYFAPEVARGRDTTEASEVFSLGATLYTAIEGQPPFGIDDDSISMLHKAARGEVIPPQSSGPVMTVILHMLEPDPARRPAMTEARDQLATAVTGAERSIEHVLTSPLLAPDGRLPVWVRRTSTAATESGPTSGERRTARIPADTAAGSQARIDALWQVERKPSRTAPLDQALGKAAEALEKVEKGLGRKLVEKTSLTQRQWDAVTSSHLTSWVVLGVAIVIIIVMIALLV